MKITNSKTAGAWTFASFAAWTLTFSVSFLALQATQAQTTLSGDHIVSGDLSVGTSGTARNLTVTGSAAVLGGFSAAGGEAYSESAAAFSGGSSDHYNCSAMSEGVVEGSLASTAMSGGYVSVTSYSTSMSGGIVGMGCMAQGTAVGGGYVDADNATAIGVGTYTCHPNSLVVGMHNVWEYDLTAEKIFTIGNGTGDSNDPVEIRNRNAFIVYKDGNIQIPKRQGDILMGEFGEEE